MPRYLRKMVSTDISQVVEIDLEAFPTQLPPPDYHRELKNRLYNYIVAFEGEQPAEPAAADSGGDGSRGLAGRLVGWLGRRLSGKNGPSPVEGQYIVGFVGCWVLSDEAHINTIAVRESCRRQGTGEMLIISAIELAARLKAKILTLEVRVSNTGAQSLYKKYGFNQAGLRRGYYTDNREDAVIMTTDNINSAQFRSRFRELKQAHAGKYGIEDYAVGG